MDSSSGLLEPELEPSKFGSPSHDKKEAFAPEPAMAKKESKVNDVPELLRPSKPWYKLMFTAGNEGSS